MGRTERSSKIPSFLYGAKGAVAAFALLVLFYVGYVVYLPHAERKFIKQIQNAFVRTNLSQIDMLETVEFDWDRVCGVSKDAYFEIEGKERKKLFLGEYFEKSPDHWHKLESYKYNWSLVFIKDETPVKVLSFNKWSKVRVGPDSFYIGYIDYPKNNSSKKSYSNSCFLKNEAVLKIDHHTSQLLLGKK